MRVIIGLEIGLMSWEKNMIIIIIQNSKPTEQGPLSLSNNASYLQKQSLFTFGNVPRLWSN